MMYQQLSPIYILINIRANGKLRAISVFEFLNNL